MRAGDLSQVLTGLSLIPHPNLLVGMETADDAGLYQLTPEMGLVQTVDFITPVVDDPYLFGAIAAANSLSDVYAKGARPLVALNIVCFPSQTLPLEILRSTMEGALQKLNEAGVALAGGHSVEDPEFKFGLSVTGLVHPQRFLRNQGGKVGDLLVLTKPLGLGIINIAAKGGLASSAALAKAIATMTSLNQKASEIMVRFDIHASTDITGFGLLGHSREMIAGTPTGIRLYASRIPYIPEAKDYANMGLLPKGLYANREFAQSMVSIASTVPRWMNDILHDPQTSGGLFVAVEPRQANALLRELHEGGMPQAQIVGEIIDQRETILVEGP